MPTKNLGMPVLALAGLACVLLVVALPKLGARLMMLPGDEVRQAFLEDKQSVANKELAAWARTRERALFFGRTSGIASDLSMITLEQAMRKGLNPATAKDDIENAIQWQEKALAKAPADSYGWSQLAYMRLITEGPTERAAWALTNAIDTNPFEPWLMVSRINMALRLYDKLGPDMKSSLPSMIRAAWSWDAYELSEAAIKNHYTALVEQALDGDEEKLEKFRDYLKEHAPASVTKPAKR